MSSYTHPLAADLIKIPEDGIILECGSRDCVDTIDLLNTYTPEKIYSFECNPESIKICRENIQGIKKIELVECAVGDIDGDIDFYATDMEKSPDKNIGASSALVHKSEDLIQKHIKVPCTRLDTFLDEKNISKIDLLCMDLQGYEKLAIEGLGERIKDVSWIITEVNFQSYYHNDVLFEELYLFLKEKGFVFKDGWPAQHFVKNIHFGDAIFRRIE